MFALEELEAAADLVHSVVTPTPQICWPLLAERAGCTVWVKHENHTPIGAFKVRGGLTYLDELTRSQEAVNGLISATRGNHGQSLPFACRRYGVPITILAPHGNSTEKNRAMRALGAELIEHGRDFDEARVEAGRLAGERGLHFVPAFHPWLVKGVATYALELFRGVSDLDTVYVPIGMGSGICGLIRTRDLLGLKTKIVGVVSAHANAVARSFEAGAVVETATAETFADGMAVRVPMQEPLEIIRAGADRIVEVSDDEVADAMRAYYTDTHNLAEGAGAAPLAALLKEREQMQGREVAVVLSGGNVDRDVFQTVLSGRTPSLPLAA
ncbi:MAG: threonine dehydratase [Methyloligellaceae bacterium]